MCWRVNRYCVWAAILSVPTGYLASVPYTPKRVPQRIRMQAVLRSGSLTRAAFTALSFKKSYMRDDQSQAAKARDAFIYSTHYIAQRTDYTIHAQAGCA